MSTPDPTAFADDWVRAWNGHDVEAVLAHFHDDVVFTSPVAARVLPETGGVVRGKAALRDYWVTALGMLPGLHFDVVGRLPGRVAAGDQLPQRAGWAGERGADVRRRPRPRGPRHLSGVVHGVEGGRDGRRVRSQ